MAKRRRPKSRSPRSNRNYLLWGGLAALLFLFLLAATSNGRRWVQVALYGPPTPTSTLTPTPTPAPAVTPTATLTPTPTATPATTGRSPTPASATTAGAPAPVYTYRIVNSYPHDPQAFTQGLVYLDGTLYESTGLRGRSSLRRVDLETGTVLQQVDLPPELFGEGIAVFDDRIVQLTWQARIGFVYDRTTFKPRRQFAYPTEGWGITHDSRRLIMSDGTATLYFWDPDTLEEIGRVQVYDNGRPVHRLNELEYINGEVFANVWQTDRIARIDPQTGRVAGWVDLSGLLSEADRAGQPVDVLNGIAYDADNDRLFVTGKLWPRLYEIELIPASQP